MNWTLHCGDARSVLETLPAESVNCVLTSPPYWGLRDYGTARWDGGDPACDHRKVSPGTASIGKSTLGPKRDGVSGQKTNGHQQEGFKHRCGKCGASRIDSQIGLESSPDVYVSSLVEVFRGVRRVLRDDGVVWLNLGDSYAGSWGNQSRTEERGTQRPINGPMLTPVLDGRYPSKQSERYAYDADAIREPYARLWDETNGGSLAPGNDRLSRAGRNDGDRPALTMPKKREVYTGKATKDYDSAGVQDPSDTKRRVLESMEKYAGANARTVWQIPTEASPYEHFAVMPRALARKCILAGSQFGGVVLDPFAGVATTGVVALEEGRSFVGIELNPKYHAMARERLANVAPLLATEIPA